MHSDDTVDSLTCVGSCSVGEPEQIEYSSPEEQANVEAAEDAEWEAWVARQANS